MILNIYVISTFSHPDRRQLLEGPRAPAPHFAMRVAFLELRFVLRDGRRLHTCLMLQRHLYGLLIGMPSILGKTDISVLSFGHKLCFLHSEHLFYARFCPIEVGERSAHPPVMFRFY